MEIKIKYLSAYLTYNYDYHKRIQLKPNNFEYIRAYYESIVTNNCNCTIIVDECSDEFIKKYTTDKITFKKVLPHNNTMFVHDYRFELFLEEILLDSSDYCYFMLTDISDIIVINSPDKIIDLSESTLYICRENEQIMTNKWFNDVHLCKPYNKFHTIFNEKIILNCGAIFGHKFLLTNFLKNFTKTINEIYMAHNITYPIDMYVLNYLVYKSYSTQLYTGNNFNTIFGDDVIDYSKCIKHK